jgi:hypothetical protein
VGVCVNVGVWVGVAEEEDVAVGVLVGPPGVWVCVGVFVDALVGSTGVFVRVGVRVGVLVGVRVGVRVGVPGGGVFVIVGVAVQRGVQVGSTKLVLVGITDGVGVWVRVSVGIGEGVNVICVCSCCCASSTETGMTSLCAQYCPVIVQAVLSSCSVSGSGAEGVVMDSAPFSPPNPTRTF